MNPWMLLFGGISLFFVGFVGEAIHVEFMAASMSMVYLAIAVFMDR